MHWPYLKTLLVERWASSISAAAPGGGTVVFFVLSGVASDSVFCLFQLVSMLCYVLQEKHMLDSTFKKCINATFCSVWHNFLATETTKKKMKAIMTLRSEAESTQPSRQCVDDLTLSSRRVELRVDLPSRFFVKTESPAPLWHGVGYLWFMH